MREKSGLNYDEVLEYIGQFGTFQRRIAFLLCFVALATGIAVVVFAFAGESKKCCVPVTIVSIRHGHQASSLPTDAMFLSVKTTTAVDESHKLPSFYREDKIELSNRCQKLRINR